MQSKQIFWILLLLYALPLKAQSDVTIRCNFSIQSIDSCYAIPAKYFIDEYEKHLKGEINNRSCVFDFPVTEPTIVKIIFKRQYTNLFVQPGDQLQLSITGDSLHSEISFSGSGAADNQLLQSFYKKFDADFDNSAVTKQILSSDVDAFESYLYDERKAQMDFLKSSATNSIREPFKKYLENIIRYNYYARLLSYPIIQANQSAQILTVKAFPAVMLQGIDSKLVNDEALGCAAYRDFLYYYAIYFTSEANDFNKFKDLNTSMESKIVTATKSFSGKSLNWYIASFLNSDINKVSEYTVEHIYRVLSLNEGSGMYTTLLKKKVELRRDGKDVTTNKKDNAKENVDEDRSVSANHFPRLKDIDGNYFTFDDLKGKVVYVDYWASWCGPCRSEMPYSKQLHAMFTDKEMRQIVFLYISIDQSEDAWKEAAKQLGLEGKLGISPGNWNSEIATYFQINSIPRYMLIDKKGNIVDQNAKRPSSGQEIYHDILKLME